MHNLFVKQHGKLTPLGIKPAEPKSSKTKKQKFSSLLGLKASWQKYKIKFPIFLMFLISTFLLNFVCMFLHKYLYALSCSADWTCKILSDWICRHLIFCLEFLKFTFYYWACRYYILSGASYFCLADKKRQSWQRKRAYFDQQMYTKMYLVKILHMGDTNSLNVCQ